MPTTALAFLVGAVAICGLPPLNGFVSEWLIYVGAFRGGASSRRRRGRLAALAVLAALALIGGLAAACFVKAFGVVFLGEPRSRRGRARTSGAGAMLRRWLPRRVLCVAIGLLARAAVAAARRAAAGAARRG